MTIGFSHKVSKEVSLMKRGLADLFLKSGASSIIIMHVDCKIKQHNVEVTILLFPHLLNKQ